MTSTYTPSVIIDNGVFNAEFLGSNESVDHAMHMLATTKEPLNTIQFIMSYLDGSVGDKFLAIAEMKNSPIEFVTHVVFRSSVIVDTGENGVDDNFASLCKGLSLLRHITHLTMEQCEIDPHRVPALIDLFQYNLPLISTLDLSGNGIAYASDDELKALGQALVSRPGHVGVKSLTLKYLGFTAETASAMLSVHLLVQLRSLNLVGNSDLDATKLHEIQPAFFTPSLKLLM
jgi:hypothetical protein